MFSVCFVILLLLPSLVGVLSPFHRNQLARVPPPQPRINLPKGRRPPGLD